MNMSSLKKSALKSKKGKKKSSSARPSGGFVDLSPVVEYDEDAADLDPERIIGRRQQQQHLDHHDDQLLSSSSRTRPLHHQRNSSDVDSDSEGGELDRGEDSLTNDFAPPIYSESTQHAINDFVESTNAQRMEEEEMLKRAIERREMLHNRIAAIEVAKAEYTSSSASGNDHHQQQQQHTVGEEKKKSKKKKKEKHRRHDSSHSSTSTSSASSLSRPFDEDTHDTKKRSGRRKSKSSSTTEECKRMDELSERIKKEASEFMNFESKFAEHHLFDGEEIHQLEDSDSFQDANDGENVFRRSSMERFDDHDGDDDSFHDAHDVSSSDDDDDDDDNELNDSHLSHIAEEESQCSANEVISMHSTDSNMDSALTGAPTPSQLSRYSNMVRLGIPDVAVLRSMERDEISNPRLVLESLKNDNNGQQGSGTTSQTSSYTRSPRRTEKKTNSKSGGKGNQMSESSINNSVRSTSDEGGGESHEQPLCEDPNYTKYFKMIKAKVPRSWVKRVLEVDGRDARILQLDPDRPLAEQVNASDIDEKGNINWKNVAIARTDSMESSDSEKEDGPASAIPADIGASVKAELAAMTARARARSPSESFGFSSRDRDEKVSNTTPADISAAAIAASNARLNRLKALKLKSGDDVSISKLGRRRENVDEIRRRAPQQAQPPQGRRRSPTSSSSVASGSGTSGKQSYEHLPLKDDPRFSKYFQMIRSRVPRSWVERVIEVDDRDPAILDLDPNKSLASQVGDDMKEQISSVISLDATERSSMSLSERGSDDVIVDDSDHKDEVAPAERENDMTSSGGLPVTEINDTEAADDRSEASSITASHVDRPRLDLAKMSDLLDRLDPGTQSRNVPQDNIQLVDQERIDRVRAYSAEEIENRVAALLDEFGTRKEHAEQNEFSLKHQELLQKSQSDIARLSTLLSAKIREDGSDENHTDGVSGESINVENLPSLLSQVLSKMEQSDRQQIVVEPATEQSSTEQEIAEQDTKDAINPTPHSAVAALFAKRAAISKDKAEESSGQGSSESAAGSTAKLSPHKALEALFAKRAAQSDDTSPPPILREDPEYSKYFKMLKLGTPRPAVFQALERDGKDASILDLDPEIPLVEQRKDAKEAKKPPAAAVGKNAALEAMFAKRAAAMDTSTTAVSSATKPLKDDPEYQKYMKMLKIGMPIATVKQALERDGKDPLVAEMDPDKSYESQAKKEQSEQDTDIPLKDMSEYVKFFKMLKMGIPNGAVRQALQKEGKDPDIADMDPNKTLSSQLKSKQKEPEKSDGPPLKDDPEYTKFFKMLKMGIPIGAVQNALKKEGKDPEIINMDPEKPLSAQSKSDKSEASQPKKKTNSPKVARKRLHWNKIDESKLDATSFWNQAKGDESLQLVGLDFDNEEFANLFTSPINKEAAPKKETNPDMKKNKNQKVQLIDSRRRMNGSILLAKFKVDLKVLAKQVNTMEYVEAEANELRGMMQLLPTKDESLALRSYLPPTDAPRSEIEDSMNKLGECERYMAVMLDVPDAHSKFECMVFRAEFESHAETIRDGTKTLAEACNAVMNSERFQKLLLYALKLGNALNTGGSNEGVSAITLDSLLKLAEAKAFDRQTSVLHYLVSIVQKNDADVLKLSEDFVPVKAAERVAMDMLSSEIKKMSHGIEKLQAVVKRNLPESCDSGSEREEDELLDITPMGRFSVSASSKIQSLSNEFDDAKSSFADLLKFFGEDSSMSPEAFFCTINTFASMFDQTHKELVRKEEAKARRKRIEEKQRLRKEEMAAKKAKS